MGELHITCVNKISNKIFWDVLALKHPQNFLVRHFTFLKLLLDSTFWDFYLTLWCFCRWVKSALTLWWMHTTNKTNKFITWSRQLKICVVRSTWNFSLEFHQRWRFQIHEWPQRVKKSHSETPICGLKLFICIERQHGIYLFITSQI